MVRNDEWVGGPLPKDQARVIWRMVPQVGNRRALLERGDADISYELPFKDFQEMKANGKLNVESLPFSNGIQYIGMNVTNRFRQSEGAAGDGLCDAVPEDHGCGAVWACQSDVWRAGRQGDRRAWPQPTKYSTDMAKAKALPTEAGYADGFETTISFDLNFAGVNGAACVLAVQESLAPARHQDHHQQGTGRQLAHRIEQEGDAAHTNVFWLARLSRILFTGAITAIIPSSTP